MNEKINKLWNEKSRRICCLVFLCIFLIFTCQASAFGNEEILIDEGEIALLEEARSLAEEAEMCDMKYSGFIAHVRSNKNSDGINTEALEYTDDLCTADAPEDVLKDYDVSEVYSIEPNYAVTMSDKTFSYVPNDTLYEDSQRYQIDQLNIPAVWKAGYEGKKDNGDPVVVAVVDTGLITTHEDIDINKIVYQRNVATEDADVTDYIGHGSSVASVIAAKKNNNRGITGVMHDCNLMPVSFHDSSAGYGYIGNLSDAIVAINYATQNGADVINMSFKVDVDVNALESVCNNAVKNGVILVAAAGNDGNNWLSYPAAYDCVVGVGSIGENGVGNEVSYFSQRGIDNVYCVAPGTDVPSISNEGNDLYSNSTGTSIASPYVASLAALAKSIDPSITYEQFMKYIRETSTDLGKPGRDDDYGYGLVNFKKLAERMTGKKMPFKYNHAQSIKVAHNHINMLIGETKRIKASVVPADSVERKLIWNSSDGSVLYFDFESDIFHTIGYGKSVVSVKSAGTDVETKITIHTRFRDVADINKHYYKPVYWAADNYMINKQAIRETVGIHEKCPKIDLVRMLWLMSGEPRVKNVEQYPDITYPTSYDEYKSALWAKKNRISNAENFSPNCSVTRKMLALILYRSAGRPDVGGTLSFNDVNYNRKTESYKAILWCEQNKIMNGYSDGSFRPDKKCTYSSIYTCLYRARNYIK